jgi:hypothetical protein
LLALLVVLGGLVALEAEAYQLRRSASGKILIWDTREPTVEIDTSAVPKLKGAAQALRAAFSAWRKAGVPIAVRSKLGEGAPVAADGRNVLSFVPSGWKFGEEVVAMTLSIYRENEATIHETDIVFNAQHLTWSAGPVPPASAFDVQNAATHEAGHFLGLDHEPSLTDAVMYPLTLPGEIQKRELSADDRAGASALAAALFAAKRDDLEEVGAPLELGGCGGGGDLALGAWLVLPFLRVPRQRRARGRGPGLLALALLLAAAPAQATVVRPLSLGQLCARAEVVSEGRVVGQHSYREGGWIFTDYRIAVRRCHRGGCQGGAITIRTPGGRVDGLVMEVVGMPRLAIGAELVVFGRRYGGAVVPIGLTAGLFRLEGTLAVRDRGLQVPPGPASERIPIATIRALLRGTP